MRSLLIESLPGCGRAVEARLRDAGHDVVRCHPPDHPMFPCNALTTGCPLDDPAGVDAVIDELVAIHVHAHHRPLAGHDRTVDIEVAHLGEE